MALLTQGDDDDGFKSLQILKSTDHLLWLVPSQCLSHTARTGSRFLFSALKPFCPKSHFDRLFTDGFDAEQIWQQIDLQAQPLLSSIRRELKHLEKNSSEISVCGKNSEKLKTVSQHVEKEHVKLGIEADGVQCDEEEEHGDMDEFGVGDVNVNVDDDDDENVGNDGDGYLETGEAIEYGLELYKGGKESNKDSDLDTKDEEEDEFNDGDEDANANELGLYDMEIDVGNDNEGLDKLENARYEDFFGTKKKDGLKRNFKPKEASDDLCSDEEPDNSKNIDRLSTHEKDLLKVRTKIEQLEKSALEPKNWTMQGEVTAAKRPKNSALEVDLVFDHNVRPPPVITEEVTASLEDLIRGRILEGRFDDVQRAPSLPSKAPKELKEMDENKSKKGLAEVYEEEYVQSTSLAPRPLSFSDEQKNEASILFKKLCLKLDALSHFHFTPKPVIEEMSVQANIPALVIEEIAPVMVSDAAMLAPEEVFAGKGDIKEETELTKDDRKRRRATKKRKFKSKRARTMEKKVQ